MTAGAVVALLAGVLAGVVGLASAEIATRRARLDRMEVAVDLEAEASNLIRRAAYLGAEQQRRAVTVASRWQRVAKRLRSRGGV